MQNLIFITSSGGSLVADASTGFILDREAFDSTDSLNDIVQVNIQEWLEYWGYEDGRQNGETIDILDLELHYSDGTICPPEEDWRNEIKKEYFIRS